MPKRVPPFTGQGDVDEWLERFFCKESTGQLPAETQVDRLVGLLRESALQHYKTLPPETQRDLQALASSLRARFRQPAHATGRGELDVTADKASGTSSDVAVVILTHEPLSAEGLEMRRVAFEAALKAVRVRERKESWLSPRPVTPIVGLDGGRRATPRKGKKRSHSAPDMSPTFSQRILLITPRAPTKLLAGRKASKTGRKSGALLQIGTHRARSGQQQAEGAAATPPQEQKRRKLDPGTVEGIVDSLNNLSLRGDDSKDDGDADDGAAAASRATVGNSVP